MESRPSTIRKLLKYMLLASILAGTLAGVGMAQSARLEGLVKDTSGAVIPGVSVVATNQATNIFFTGVSSESGRYVFVTLDPGEYTLSAELPGFKRFVRRGVTLNVGDARTIDITLALGEISDEVVVTDVTPTVDQTTSKIGAVIQRQQILDLPLNGRDPLDLFLLQPGMSYNNSGSVDGLRRNANNLRIEGVWGSDASYDSSPTSTYMALPLEAVGEYRATTNSADLSAGRGSGAQVSVALKSGTNQFHGSAFWFNRNEVYNANEWFSNQKGQKRAVFQRHQFGYSIGGPVIKDRTFFFHTLEWNRTKQDSTPTRLVYTKEAKQGIFRYNNKDRNRTDQVDPLTGVPLIPAEDISTIDLLTIDPTRTGWDPSGRVQKVLSILPDPNAFDEGDGFNTAGFRFNSTDPRLQWIFLAKIDHKLTDRHQLKFTIGYDHDDNMGDYKFPEAIYPYRRTTSLTNKRSGTFGWTASLSPTLINEFTMGGYDRFNHFKMGNPGSKDPNGIFILYGLGSGRDAGGNLIDEYQDQRNPIVALNANNTTTWIKDTHTFKWGFEVARSSKFNWFGGDNYIPLVRTSLADNPATVPKLPGLNTNDRSLAQQLVQDMTGSVGWVQQQFHVNYPIERGFVPFDTRYRRLVQPEYGAFFQDTWKFRPNLTLNYGVRWDYLTPAYAIDGVYTYPKEGPSSVLGMSSNQFMPAYEPAGYYQAAPGPDKGKGVVKSDWNNFSPAVGFIWDPTGGGKMSISANYRLGFDRHMISTYSRLEDQNQGLSITRTISPLAGTRFSNVSTPGSPNQILPIAPPTELFFILPNTREGLGYAVNHDAVTPYTQSWSLRIQREFGRDWTFEISYVGNIGVGEWRAIAHNELKIRENGFLDGFLAAQRNLAANGNPNKGEDIGVLAQVFGPLGGIPSSQNTRIRQGQVARVADYADTLTYNDRRGGLLEAAGLPENFFRGNPQVDEAHIMDNLSNSTYHGMKIQVSRRFSDGVYLQANYSLGKGLSDYVGGQGMYNEFRDNRNRRLDKRLQDYDQTHVININGIFDLPIGSGRRFGSDWHPVLDAFLGGWQINGIFQFATDRPFTIDSGYYNLTTEDYSTGYYSGPDGNITSKVIKTGTGVIGLTDDEKGYFSTPEAGTAGMLSQYFFRGPSYSNIDASIFKNFRVPWLGEQGRIQFRAEFFNLLNHPTFNNPSSTFTSGSFGNITSTNGSERIGQFALKLYF